MLQGEIPLRKRKAKSCPWQNETNAWNSPPHLLIPSGVARLVFLPLAFGGCDIGRSPASELKARKGVCGSCGLMLANLIFPSFPDVPICFDFEVEQKAQKHRLN